VVTGLVSVATIGVNMGVLNMAKDIKKVHPGDQI